MTDRSKKWDPEDKSTCYFCGKRIFGYSKEKGHWDIELHSKEQLNGTSIRVHTLCLKEYQLTKRKNQRNE